MYPPHAELPPPDRVLSPLTGWTRAHWERLADHLLDSAARYATPDFAQFRLPGRPSGAGVVSDGIEGFARTFLLAAFRIAGAADKRSVAHLIDRYARGLAAGTDNSNKRSRAWPGITDCSQQMVEAAAIAVALHETRDVLWDTLDARTQDSVRDWLGGFTGKRTHPNNWILFQVVTEQFLKSVGGRHDDGEIERGLDRIEDWYAGDGWYTDGAGQNFDYYIGWAMHLYPLLWARIAGADGDDRANVYRRRLSEFLDQYQYFFGADGAPVHQGRSLTYRYAAAAPLWLGELAGGADAGATPLPPGRARRLASGAVRHFTERGVPDERGLLTLGWYDTFLPATQNYSGPGSPYWASKGFLGLLLPAGHPAWTQREEPGPNDRGDQVVAMPAPGFLLHSTRHDGVVRLLNHGSDHQSPALPGSPPAQPGRPAAPPGSDNSNKRASAHGHGWPHGHDDPHYAKLAYSSRTGPGASEPSWRAGVDNHVAVLGPDDPAFPDRAVTRRIRIERIAVRGDQAGSRYRAVLPDGAGCAVETAVLVRGPWEIRAHLVSAPPGTTVRDGGYAIADDAPPAARVGGGDHGRPWALARRPDGLASLMLGLHGWADGGVTQEVGATAFGPCSAVPYLISTPRRQAETVSVTLVTLTGDAVRPEALSATVSATVSGRTVRLRLPGETAELRLGDVP